MVKCFKIKKPASSHRVITNSYNLRWGSLGIAIVPRVRAPCLATIRAGFWHQKSLSLYFILLSLPNVSGRAGVSVFKEPVNQRFLWLLGDILDIGGGGSCLLKGIQRFAHHVGQSIQLFQSGQKVVFVAIEFFFFRYIIDCHFDE